MNKQSKYLDKVIEFLVGDTRIDYEQEKISSPSFPLSSFPLPFYFTLSLFSSTPSYFQKYCKDTYGLTEPEIEYVWKHYKDIIKDKINEQ